MYLPSEAVFGFDRTHIRRISPQEYREEDDSPIAPPRTRCLTGSSRICNLLRSRDPNVEFCSKFPIRDSLGCEISVTYQIICMEVRTELQRVTQGGALTRRSGVLPSTGMGLLDEGDRCRRSSVPEQEEVDRIHRNGLEVKARPVTHVHVPSLLNGDGVSSARLPAKGTCITTALSQQDTSNISGHGRISSFSIYCDSGCNPCGVAQLRETVVDQQQQPSQQLPEPQSVVVSDGRQSLFASGLVCLPDNKLERVLNAEDIQDYLQASQATCLAPPQRSSTASPAQIVGKRRKKEREVDDGWDNVQNNRVSVCEAAIAEPILLGTTGSPEPRATKRLFTINHVSNFRRTAHHAELIPSQAYGVHSKTIPAALVDPLINKCLEKLYSGREFLAVNASAPQLQPGLIVPMGDYSYHIVRYHASSDVFEAREVQSKGANRTQILENDIASSLDSPLPQVLIYRWSVRAFQQGINETHRAALGLSHIVPSTAMSVGVSGYLYTDAGLTVITVPNPYYAVPLSLVPLSARSFPTCIKLLLKMLSTLLFGELCTVISGV
ncbi:hypothetical protein ERJ75_000989900 [Trypanosoma vivax]|nr:hypothetical protein ERJ75_000989900 [Trypanosoma vivax]